MDHSGNIYLAQPVYWGELIKCDVCMYMCVIVHWNAKKVVTGPNSKIKEIKLIGVSLVLNSAFL